MLAGIDRVISQSRATRPVRIVILGGLVVILGVALGWPSGLILFLLATMAELWEWTAERLPGLRARSPRAWVAIYVGGMLASSLAWTWIAISLWRTTDPALRVAATVMLSTLLLDALGLAPLSRNALMIFAAPPAAALVALPLLFGGYGGTQKWVLASVVGLAVAYLAKMSREMVRQAEALREANARLLEQEQDLIARTEQAQQASAAKSRFLAMMSHELRTPMNGVLGMARALTQSRLDQRQREHVDMLIRSGDGLMVILNDLLDLSKAEAGKLELENIPFDLRDLSERVHDLWTESASAKGVRLVLESDVDKPFWVCGDPTRLRQILVNLVSNALKFTTHGEVRLRICQGGDDGALNRVQFEVSDTGTGLTQEQAGRLFQAFAQAEASTTRQFGGIGLGLSICQELAQLMGAQIAVESTLGKGSRFYFTLSLPRTEPVTDNKQAAVLPSLEGVRLLVADDNAINLAVARAILEAVGGNVVTVGDGRAALEALRTSDFHAVLMDVHMPVLGGIEALKAIRAGQAGPQDRSVIALTADTMAGVEAELLAEGFDAVEPKPIVPATLIAALGRVMAEEPYRREHRAPATR